MARRLGVSGSRLFALAVSNFMERERRKEMLVRLNQAYVEVDPAETRAVRSRWIVKERWLGRDAANVRF